MTETPSLFRLLAFSLLLPLGVYLAYRGLWAFGVRSEIVRRIFVVLGLAASAVPFVLLVAVLAASGGKAVVALVFLAIAVIPFWISFRRTDDSSAAPGDAEG